MEIQLQAISRLLNVCQEGGVICKVEKFDGKVAGGAVVGAQGKEQGRLGRIVLNSELESINKIPTYDSGKS